MIRIYARRICELSAIVISVLVFSSTMAFAKMSHSDGIESVYSFPKPAIADNYVLLDVPHIRQEPNLCVPTSAAMILSYFGEDYGPELLKSYAEGYKPKSKRNANFTYWEDMNVALRKIKKNWKVRSYPDTKRGFESGMLAIKASLRKRKPVMIEVHLAEGHTFVVVGYDEVKNVIYIRDPGLAGNLVRVLSYDELQRSWNNHRFGKKRSAFFPQ